MKKRLIIFLALAALMKNAMPYSVSAGSDILINEGSGYGGYIDEDEFSNYQYLEFSQDMFTDGFLRYGISENRGSELIYSTLRPGSVSFIVLENDDIEGIASIVNEYINDKDFKLSVSESSENAKSFYITANSFENNNMNEQFAESLYNLLKEKYNLRSFEYNIKHIENSIAFLPDDINGNFAWYAVENFDVISKCIEENSLECSVKILDKDSYKDYCINPDNFYSSATVLLFNEQTNINDKIKIINCIYETTKCKIPVVCYQSISVSGKSIDIIKKYEDKSNIKYGNIDGNDSVDLSDLTMISQYTLKDIELTVDQIRCADVNADGEVNLQDLALLKQYVMNDNVQLGVDIK